MYSFGYNIEKGNFVFFWMVKTIGKESINEEEY